MANKWPLIDTSINEGSFIYPLGAAVREPEVEHRLPLGNSLGYHMPPHQEQSHSGALSNATAANADVRLNMKRSITDLFSDIGEVSDGKYLSGSGHITVDIPRIHLLCELMQLRGDAGDIILYTPTFSGETRKRIFRRPVPLTHISSKITLSADECSRQTMQIFSLFSTVAINAAEELAMHTFAYGKPSTAIGPIAASVLTNILNESSEKFPYIKTNYQHITEGEVCLWLTDGKKDFWDFSEGTIEEHPFSMILFQETNNDLFQQRDETIVSCREGVKLVVQKESLLGGHRSSLAEKVYPPGSRSPRVLSRQARRLLSLILNVRDPNLLNIAHISPSPDFLISNAVRRMIAAAIYSPSLTIFALMVERALDPTPDERAGPNAPPRSVPPGYRWMPLHIISFAASFIIIELVRIAGLERMGGRDIKKASTIHTLSEFEEFIFGAVTDSVLRLFNSPHTKGGKVIHRFLKDLIEEWGLEEIARKHWEDSSTFSCEKRDKYDIF